MAQAISKLADIAAGYDAVLCDIWGVVHNGREVFQAAAAALLAFREAGGTVVLVSNVPRPRDPIPGQIRRLGGTTPFFDAVVTSGDATRAELAARAPGPYLKIGTPEDESLWAGLDLRVAGDVAEAAFVAMAGLRDGFTETPQDYLPMLRQAKARDLEFICANPDIVVRVGDRLMWCAGAVAQEYAQIGGRVVMAGKPFAPIYALAMAELASLRGAPVPKSRVLAIGDGVGTDVLGAANAEIDCLFIASGLHGDALMNDGALDGEKVKAALAKEKTQAKFVMGMLA